MPPFVNTIGMYLYYTLLTACVVTISVVLLGFAYVVVEEVINDIRIRIRRNVRN